MRLLKGLFANLPLIGPLITHRDALIAENRLLRQSPAFVSSRQPTLSTVINPAHYEDPVWIALHHELSTYSFDKHCFQNCSNEVYRKGWEWTHCLYGLGKLGMLEPDHRGVGVGAGRECVIFYLADHIAHVTATDLYGEAGWTAKGGREADLALLEASKAACPASVDLSRIIFENQDGTRLTYPDDSFDFAWSLSSIEHFGGHAAAAAAMREMARVVRPGGIVAVATEMLMLEEYAHSEYFTRTEITDTLIAACPTLDLIGPIDFDCLPPDYLVDSIVAWSGIDRRRRHVVLNDGQVQWTSIMLFLQVREPA